MINWLSLTWRLQSLVMDDLVDVGGDLYVVEHLVVDDSVAVGGELCIAEHGLACIDGDLHVGTNVEFVVSDVGFFATRVDSLVVDGDERFLFKHYV